MCGTDLENETKHWMRLNARDYDNPTSLAEAAAHHFDHDEWLDDDTHWVWDIALNFYDII